MTTTERHETLVDRVQDTARWVAMARARETDRRDAVFRDPLARSLAGHVGAELVQSVRLDTWPIIARTYIIDGLIDDAIRDGADAVVNIAAGLDSRPFRMDLPPTLTWIEIDHADILADKETRLGGHTPVCRLERIARDLSVHDGRREMLAEVASRFRRVVVMSEGLLCYLEPKDALGLATDVRAMPGVFRYIADLQNKVVNDLVARRTGFRGTAAPKFGPEEGPLVFEPLGWRVVSATSILKTAGRLKRLPFLLSLFARLPDRPYGTPGRPWSGVCVWELR
jgi:methyltransferase (TIGR00027 family)